MHDPVLVLKRPYVDSTSGDDFCRPTCPMGQIMSSGEEHNPIYLPTSGGTMKGNINMGCHNITNVGTLDFCASNADRNAVQLNLNNVTGGYKVETNSLASRVIFSKTRGEPVTIGSNLNLFDGQNNTNLSCGGATTDNLYLKKASSRIENISNPNNPILCHNDVAIRTPDGSDALFCKKVYASDRTTEGGRVGATPGINLYDVNSVSGVGDPKVIDFQGQLRQPDANDTCVLNAPTRTRSEVETYPDRLVSYNNVKTFFSNPVSAKIERFEEHKFALPSKRICDISQFVNLPFKHYNVTEDGKNLGSADTTPIDLREKTPLSIFCVGIGKQAKLDPNPSEGMKQPNPVKQLNPTVTPLNFQQFVCPFGIFMNPGSCQFSTWGHRHDTVDKLVRFQPYMNYSDAKMIDGNPGLYASKSGNLSYYDEDGRAENWRSVCRYYTAEKIVFKSSTVVLPDGWARSFEHFWDNMPATLDEGSMPGVGLAHAFPHLSYNYNGDGQGFDSNGKAGLLETQNSFVPSDYPKRVRFCLVLCNSDKDPKKNFDDVTFHQGPIIWYYDIISTSIHEWKEANIEIPANTFYGVGIIATGQYKDRMCPLFAVKSTHSLVPENFSQRGSNANDKEYYWRSPYSLISLCSSKFGPNANRVNYHAVSADGDVWCPYIPPYVPEGDVSVPSPTWISDIRVGSHVFADRQLPNSTGAFLGISALFDYWLSDPGKTWDQRTLTGQYLDDKWNDGGFTKVGPLLRDYSAQGEEGFFSPGRAGLLPEQISFEISEA